MTRLIRTICALTCSFAFASTSLLAQTTLPTFSVEFNYFERQSVNETFNAGLASWNVNGRAGSITVIDWANLPNNPTQAAGGSKFLSVPFDSTPQTLGKAIKMTGATGLWQYVPINGKSTRQALHCNARKRKIPNSPGTIGWASYGVFYYDAGWNEIGFFEEEILGDLTEYGNLDGSNFYSQSTLGCRVPPNAKHSIIWIANDGSNTETYADDLILLNVFDGAPLVDRTAPARNQLSQNPAKLNLVANSSFDGILFDLTNPVDRDTAQRDVLPNRDFFWNSASLFDMTPATFPRDGILRGATSSYWQDITVLPQQTYSITAAYGLFGTFGAVGVDMYDANWKKIATKSLTLNGASQAIEVNSEIVFDYVTGTFTTPANVKYASAYIWRAGGEGDIEIVLFSIKPITANTARLAVPLTVKSTTTVTQQVTAAAKTSLSKNATR